MTKPDRFILPVFSYWRRKKGREWAFQIHLEGFSIDDNGCFAVRHKEEGFLPVPPGAVLTQVTRTSAPMDRGYDNSDYLTGKVNAGFNVLVYTDPETAKEIEAFEEVASRFACMMSLLYLDANSPILDT